MEYDSYIIVCNPCNEQVIAKDTLILNVNGYKPVVSRIIMNDEFVPIVILTSFGKIYKCPQCKSSSGTLAPQNPTDLKLFSHTYTCSNKNKYPVEN